MAFAMSVSVCLFRASLLWIFSQGTLTSFNILKTDSHCCAGMTYSCPVSGLETHIKNSEYDQEPYKFLAVY